MAKQLCACARYALNYAAIRGGLMQAIEKLWYFPEDSQRCRVAQSDPPMRVN
jgi:hypothetical protein